MVTGSPQLKHKLYYSVLNFYPDGKKRVPKWIPTGLKERGNKKNAENITNLLAQLFNKDGSLIGKYAQLYNPVEQIKKSIDLPEVTLDSLNKMLGKFIQETNPELQKTIMMADSIPTADQEENIKNMLFCDYMVFWLEHLAPKLDKGTYGSYKGFVHGRIYKFFYDTMVKVKDLQPGHIETFYRLLSIKDGLSQTTIQHYHCNIRKALQQLYIKQTIPNNPADLIANKPVRETYIASFYDEELINEYLQIVKDTKMELPVLGACFYGFRRSEVIGLKDTAINLSRHQLTVRHTVTLANTDGRVEVLRKDGTKSKSSLRSMPLVDAMETAIENANERQEHYQHKLGSLYCKSDRHYLCKDEKGELLNPNYVTARHKDLLEKHKMPHIRFHDLRHSCATLLQANNVPLEKIKEWLGHSDIKVTERYAHMNVSMVKSEMADILKEVLRYETIKTSV